MKVVGIIERFPKFPESENERNFDKRYSPFRRGPGDHPAKGREKQSVIGGIASCVLSLTHPFAPLYFELASPLRPFVY